MADLITAYELYEKLLAYDPWESCDGECDPNPSDAFSQGARAVKQEAERILKGETNG